MPFLQKQGVILMIVTDMPKGVLYTYFCHKEFSGISKQFAKHPDPFNT